MVTLRRVGKRPLRSDLVVLRIDEREALVEAVDVDDALAVKKQLPYPDFSVSIRRGSWTYGGETHTIGIATTSWLGDKSHPLAILGVFDRRKTQQLDRMVEHAVRMNATLRQ